MKSPDKLVIVGDSAFAEIAYEYFTHDSNYSVVAFAVEEQYLKRDSLFGLPVVAFETVQEKYTPGEHSFFAANVYTQKNQLRRRLYRAAKEKGYTPASYISSRAFVWRNVRFGEHCFIFENNVLQPFVTIGNNVVLWSGNHIGHHSTIMDHCFVSSHVVVSGFCRIGQSCFMGVNSTVANNLTIGDDCIIGAGALILSNVEDNQTAVGIWKRRKEPPAAAS
jgi:sugar O-acyltransferase (sialic acid O-acetyltransferase NeuD family)